VCDLVFLGLVGLADPVRASARAALRDLSDAGVRVVMLTGDHPSTAEAIAEELDLPSHEVVTGADIDALDDDVLADRLERASIFARVTPAQKVRLVRVLSARGKTVAMTGDGANDAAAIALADVGIAVGAHATGAARSVADLVVTDGRIETIVDAILEGRGMWASVRDAVSILVGGNFGEIAFTLLPGLLSGRAPLNARQLLLVNLVTDTLPSLAIAVSSPRREDLERLMREGPEASLGRRLDRDLVVRAAVTGSAAAAAYTMSRLTGGGPARAGTVGLVALTGAQLGQTLIAGGRDLGVFAASVGSLAALFAVIEIPGVSHFFGCRPLGPVALSQAVGTTVAATAVAWALPRWLERREARAQRGSAAAVPPDRVSLVEDEDEPLFGGLLEAA
jgi:cation-transporting ATPase I